MLARTLLMMAVALAAQQATFRSDVTYVEVDVLVTDAEGRFVPGLTAGDFELTESGRSQTIDSLSEIRVPVPDFQAAGNEHPIPSDVASNETAADARVYLIVFDDVQIRFENTLPVRQAARRFVNQYLGPNDLAAVAYTSGRTDVTQDFTTDRARLLLAIEGFAGRSHGSSAMEKAESYMLSPRKLGARDQLAQDRLYGAKSAYEVVGRLAGHLGSLKGRRKTMILFSEGASTETVEIGDPAEPSFDAMTPSARALMEAVSAATRANVHIYPVDPNRLNSPSTDVRLQIPLDPPAVAAGVTLESFDAERLRGQANLFSLAELTGGRAIVRDNDFDQAFARVVRDSSNYYLLGYAPSPAPPEGRFQSIRVRVKRPGLTVTARPGYYTSKARATSARTVAGPLDALMTAAVPEGGLSMRVATAPFRDKPKSAAVLVAIDVPRDAFTDSPAAGELTLVYAFNDATRRAGPVVARTIDIRIPVSARDAVRTSGFRILFRVALRPGRYQGRFAASMGSTRGSVFADIDVPDFSARALSWSGVSMTSLQASRTPAWASGDDASKALPVPPSAVRSFARGDTIAAYAVAYRTGSAVAQDLDLDAVVRNAQGRTVFATSEARPGATGRDAGQGLGFRVDVPTGELPAGRYVLTISAAPRAARATPVWHDVPFDVR